MGRSMITCKDCGEEKELKGHGLCLNCWMRRYRATVVPRVCGRCGNVGRIVARGICQTCYNKERHIKDKDAENAYSREWRSKNGDYQKNYDLQRGFGITLDEYNAILEVQGGVCAICGKTPKEEGKYLAVDHDHITGEVRGILCTLCNLMVGCAEDDPGVLSKGAEYLTKGQVAINNRKVAAAAK